MNGLDDTRVTSLGEQSLVESELTRKIINAAMNVHRELGPGLLESAYHACLCHEFSIQAIPYKSQVDLPITYKGSAVDCGYRIDLIAADRVVVELKAVEKLLPVHVAQLMTYLRLSRLRVGLLINFNVPVLRQGIVRRVL